MPEPTHSTRNSISNSTSCSSQHTSSSSGCMRAAAEAAQVPKGRPASSSHTTTLQRSSPFPPHHLYHRHPRDHSTITHRPTPSVLALSPSLSLSLPPPLFLLLLSACLRVFLVFVSVCLSVCLSPVRFGSVLCPLPVSFFVLGWQARRQCITKAMSSVPICALHLSVCLSVRLSLLSVCPSVCVSVCVAVSCTGSRSDRRREHAGQTIHSESFLTRPCLRLGVI